MRRKPSKIGLKTRKTETMRIQFMATTKEDKKALKHLLEQLEGITIETIYDNTTNKGRLTAITVSNQKLLQSTIKQPKKTLDTATIDLIIQFYEPPYSYSFGKIAKHLNDLNYRTTSNNPFHAMTIKRIIDKHL